MKLIRIVAQAKTEKELSEYLHALAEEVLTTSNAIGVWFPDRGGDGVDFDYEIENVLVPLRHISLLSPDVKLVR